MKKNTLLMAGVPAARGNPDHYEHLDDRAETCFNAEDQVLQVHTPQDALRRIHELMHARHTTREHMEALAGVPPIVAQIVEDCRLHTRHWPWQETPRLIADKIHETLTTQRKDVEQRVINGKFAKDGPEVFLSSLREAAVYRGLDNRGLMYDSLARSGNESLARECLEYIGAGDCATAAARMTSFFFPEWFKEKMEEKHAADLEKLEGKLIKAIAKAKAEGKGLEDIDTGKYEPAPMTGRTDGKYRKPMPGSSRVVLPSMQVIRLPMPNRIVADGEHGGLRVSNMGARMHRPALRRPILPARLFVRSAYSEIGGTTLIDASSSMGDFSILAREMAKDPHATLAYYAGNDDSRNPQGWLYIFAEHGWRATKAVQPDSGGNSVDGPALDWLLEQQAPRTLITDLGFCGAWDSHIQVMRAIKLHRAGVIKITAYNGEVVVPDAM